MKLKDNFKSINNLRKELLDVKGKLYILGVYMAPNGAKRTILCNSSDYTFHNTINFKRAINGAVLQGLYIAFNRYRMPSGTKLVKVIDWGIKYGNADTIIKRIGRRGSYITVVRHKGKIVQSQKWGYVDNEEFNDVLEETDISEQFNEYYTN